MEQKYFVIPTKIGREKILAHSLANTNLDVTHYAVGDGGGEYYAPDSTSTALKNETWRGPITNMEILEESPNTVRFSTFINGEIGGFTVRETSIIDSEGDTIAIGNTPSMEKAGIIEGVNTGMTLSMLLMVEDATVLNLSVDPNIAGASKNDLANLKSELLVEISSHVEDQNAHEYLQGRIRELTESFLKYYTKEEVDKFLEDIDSQFANIGTPEIYELEPLNGFFFPEGGSNFYCKTQENIVVLSANISKDVDESIGNQEVIGQLPYGFCPATLVQTAGMLYNPRISPPILPGIVAINEKGEITVVHHTQEPYYRVHFSCTFPAQ